MNNHRTKVTRIMMEKYGKDLSFYNHSFLEKTLKSRIELTPDGDSYPDLLLNDPQEEINLSESLLITYSEFFRDSLSFDYMEKIIFPDILHKKNLLKPEIRIWSAGCSSGQEPYSIAILSDNHKNSISLPVKTTIFATDISLKHLDMAKRGVYDSKSLLNVRLAFLQHYFSIVNDDYILSEKIKKQVNFYYYDLLDKRTSSPESSIYGDFDLITCCNLLFYYNEDIQQYILSKFYKSLLPDGYFITGEAEISIVKNFGHFYQIIPSVPIFIKQ